MGEPPHFPPWGHAHQAAVRARLSAGQQKNRLAAAGELERMTKSELVAVARQLQIVVRDSTSKEELVSLVRKVRPVPPPGVTHILR